MKKVLRLVLLLTIMLFGCESSEEEIAQVSLSHSTGFGKVNPDFFTVYEDTEALVIFHDIFSSAEKFLGQVDIAEPEYDVEIVYKNGEQKGYHLWIGKKGQQSTLMKVEDTGTIYTVSEEMTDKLIDLVEQ